MYGEGVGRSSKYLGVFPHSLSPKSDQYQISPYSINT